MSGEHESLWRAIDAYAMACGGDVSPTRMPSTLRALHGGLIEVAAQRWVVAENARRYGPVPEPPAGTCIPIDPLRGEWRCRCAPDPTFDQSANPRYVAACARCGVKRPPWIAP